MSLHKIDSNLKVKSWYSWLPIFTVVSKNTLNTILKLLFLFTFNKT